MLSPPDQCVCLLCVLWSHLCDDDDDDDDDDEDGRAWRWVSFEEPYTSVQSEDQPVTGTLGSALHQRLCQQGLFRRGPMTDCDVAGVFGQNGAIHRGTGGREWQGEERSGWGKEKGGWHRDETERGEGGRGEARQTDGGEGGTGKALTDSNGASWQSRNIVWNQSVIMELLSLSLHCGTRPFTVTICSVLSQFTLLLGCTKVTALYPRLSASLTVSFFVNELSTQSHTVLYQGDLHKNWWLMPRGDVLQQGFLLHYWIFIFLTINLTWTSLPSQKDKEDAVDWMLQWTTLSTWGIK